MEQKELTWVKGNLNQSCIGTIGSDVIHNRTVVGNAIILWVIGNEMGTLGHNE